MSESTSESLQKPAHRPRELTRENRDHLRARFAEGLAPPPLLSVAEWADTHRVLPDTSAEPGPWRTDRVPYLRAIMDALSPDHPAERVILMKGAQVGGTEAGNNWIGYMIHINPGMMLVVNPGLAEVRRNTRTRIDPLIESCDVLNARVVPMGSRKAGNSAFRKKFPGGELVMTGSNSAVGLRSLPARYLFLDEVDAYVRDADGEGDPVDLAVRRTATFRGRRKIFECSTPLSEGVSRIFTDLRASTYNRLFVTCKHCGAQDYIRWECIRWPTQRPAEAAYYCSACEGVHTEADKAELLGSAHWRPTNRIEGTLQAEGFHLPALYSPFETWGEQATFFEQSKKDPNRLKVFVNTVLGEPWHEEAEQPDWERLYLRREAWEEEVPREVIYLTAGVDVQADRIELEIVGWDRYRRSWGIYYGVLEGDTAQANGQVWQELTVLLARQWKRGSGHLMPISRAAIDEGYRTQTVRAWARRQDMSRVLVIRGSDRGRDTIGKPTHVDVREDGKRIARGLTIRSVGVNILKTELYTWLNMPAYTEEQAEKGDAVPEGYCRFPETYVEEYFRQLTAEQLVKRSRKGYDIFVWEKDRDRRNEALDCRVYARAAALSLNVDSWPDGYWDALEAEIDELEANPLEKGSKGQVRPITSSVIRRKRRVIQSRYMRR